MKLELRIPPAVLVALSAALMWLTARHTPGLALDDATRTMLYRLLTFVGATLIIIGVVTFRRARTTVHPSRPQDSSKLVVKGIYRLTRNPMYLGMVIMLLGWAVFLRSAWSVIIIFLFIAWMNRYQISAEERHLAELFGERYQRYCQRVRRWI